ncbi:hypothetical protein LQ567_03000 [Niabella pedocola]|uniref:SD-repeat containing protein B domain-containing protein n=1 Tax=Niabella pedocola TaxID=1752077 RepID=A0ABS8PKT9_9BACT|nr:hypothetical protein [Niabella pedocola]MCD2421713.1 hypothetical protein [Niabella pedocola]
MKKKVLTGILIFHIAGTAFSQNIIQLVGAPGAGGPAGKGPETTNQTVTFFVNSTTPTNPAVTAMYSLSNQQFSAIEGNPTTPGVAFGSNLSLGTDVNLVPAAGSGELFYPTMNVVGSPLNSYFTPCNGCTPGSGINVAANRAIELQPFADALIDAANNNLFAITARVRFADLTITFSKPVSNPVLHFAGIGGQYYYTAGGKYYNHGYASEFDLLTPGISLKKLSGSSKFDVMGNTIRDTAANLGFNAVGALLNGTMRYGAAGSVAVLGTNITTLTFRIFIQGDPGDVTTAAGAQTIADAGRTPKWSAALGGVDPAGGLYGDALTIGLSLQAPVTISGNVFNDPDGGNVNNSSGVANTVPGGMYINLVDANNMVVASVPVSTDGTYTFPSIFEGTYTAVLSTNALDPQTTAATGSVPAGWQNTGEYNGAPGSGNDGLADGASAVFTVGTSDAVDINFGIRQVALPVIFGDISATIVDGKLDVKWSTLTEINNNYFNIEVSNDGKTFTSIGTMNSSAVNGNSSIKTDYHFQTALPVGAAFAVIAFAILLPTFKKRKWRFLSLLTVLLVVISASCNKNNSVLSDNANNRLFIRIAQVNMDGQKTYSKVVSVVSETK